MIQLTTLEPYADALGNEVVYAGPAITEGVLIVLHGRNNRLVVAHYAAIVDLGVQFFGDGSVVEIGGTKLRRTGLRLAIRVGHDSGVRIGENVGSQGRTVITAVEGCDVTIGDDCMIAIGVEIRSDDAHPIFDVRTGERVNFAQSVAVGNHVWIAKFATIMGGVRVGDGAVIGFRSIVTADVPNNAVAVGAPARVVRRDIAWERSKLLRRRSGEPGLLPNEKQETFWNLSEEEPAEWPTPVERPEPREREETPAPLAAARATLPRGERPGIRRRAGRLLRRLGLR